MGQSLGDVRVHIGAESQDAAQAIRARAYTDGKDIHFAPGQYRPDTAAGRRLVAHEVAHTLQNAERAALGLSSSLSAPGDSSEREADRFADAFVTGRAVKTPRLVAGARPAVHRDVVGDAADAVEELGNDYTVSVSKSLGVVSLGGSITFSRADKARLPTGAKTSVKMKKTADGLGTSIAGVIASMKAEAKISGLSISVATDFLEVSFDPRDAKLAKVGLAITGDATALAGELGLPTLDGVSIKVKLSASVEVGPEVVAQIARASKAARTVKASTEAIRRKTEQIWRTREHRASSYRKMKAAEKQWKAGDKRARYTFKNQRKRLRTAARRLDQYGDELKGLRKDLDDAAKSFERTKAKLKGKWARIAGSKMGRVVAKALTTANVMITAVGLAVDLYHVIKAIDGDALALEWAGGGIGDSDAGASETGEGGGVEGGTEAPDGVKSDVGGGSPGGDTPDGTGDRDVGSAEEAEVEGVAHEGGEDADHEDEPSADRNGDGEHVDGDGGDADDAGPDLSALHENARAVFEAMTMRDDDGPAIDATTLELINDFVPVELTEAQLEQLLAALEAHKAAQATDIDTALGVLYQEVSALFADPDVAAEADRGDERPPIATTVENEAATEATTEAAGTPPAQAKPDENDYANLWVPGEDDAAALTVWLPDQNRLVKNPAWKDVIAARAPRRKVADGWASVVDVHVTFKPIDIGVRRSRYAYTLQLDVTVGTDDDSMLYESPEYQYYVLPPHDGMPLTHQRFTGGVFATALAPLIELDDSGTLALVGEPDFEIPGKFKGRITSFRDAETEEEAGQNVHYVRLEFEVVELYSAVSLQAPSGELQPLAKDLRVAIILPISGY